MKNFNLMTQRGSTVVEFAIVMIALATLALIGLETTIAVQHHHKMSMVARTTAESASRECFYTDTSLVSECLKKVRDSMLTYTNAKYKDLSLCISSYDTSASVTLIGQTCSKGSGASHYSTKNLQAEMGDAATRKDVKRIAVAEIFLEPSDILQHLHITKIYFSAMF